MVVRKFHEFQWELNQPVDFFHQGPNVSTAINVTVERYLYQNGFKKHKKQSSKPYDYCHSVTVHDCNNEILLFQTIIVFNYT